jgi:sugar phosphate isomerase/epimerase
MQLLFFCPRWGSEELSWEEFCRKVKKAGYDGVEAGVPFDTIEKGQMATSLEAHGLLLIGQYWQSFEKDFTEHKLSYQKHLYHLAELSPLKIDAQTGKDYFNFDENKELFETADRFSQSTGIPVAHETHRNKALFAAHVAHQFLERIPNLRITADFSHWCNVAESLLEDQQESIDLAIHHTIHIHARVGHAQGPQVTEPRLPEWKNSLDIHANWWKRIVEFQRNKAASQFTITPEFGPRPYMPLMPISQVPLADQWEINVWMMQFLKQFLA